MAKRMGIRLQIDDNLCEHKRHGRVRLQRVAVSKVQTARVRENPVCVYLRDLSTSFCYILGVRRSNLPAPLR